MAQCDSHTTPPSSFSDQRYHLLVEMCPDVIVCLSRDFTILSLNPAFDRLTGWPRSEWIGKSFLHLVHHHDQSLIGERLHRAMNGKQLSLCEVRLVTKSGDCLIVELSLAAEQENGHVTGLLGLARDMTKSKEEEEVLAQRDARLQQAPKMEAIGRLAGGIAHDFNNLLTIITGYSQLLLSRLRHDDLLRGDVEEIRKAAVRAASLTQQLLAFSRRQVMVPRVLNLNVIVETVDTMLQRLIGEHIHLVTVLEPSLGHVKADPGQMEQVMMNLAINARDAMPQGGKLTIETANVEAPLMRPLSEGALLPGRYAKLCVSDTGCGMDRETQARIFEPFFTTKGQGQGTGLGLATVYGIVRQSDGHICVDSEPGRGTVFHIYLPIVDAPIETGKPDKPQTTLPYGTETVLLVEDEPTVRLLIRDTLRLFGYTVLEARHGFEAQLIGSQRRDRIDLLVTDVVMPQMSGRELADGLMRMYPGVKVLYMSGYTENAMIDHGVLSSGSAFLQKPFTPEVLARKVREILDTVR
jgi:PAS domain S-box-containing protein